MLVILSNALWTLRGHPPLAGDFAHHLLGAATYDGILSSQAPLQDRLRLLYFWPDEYPPLMYAVTATLYRVVGGGLQAAFWSLGGFVVVMTVFAYLTCFHCGGRAGAITGSLLCLAMPPVLMASRLYTPDFPLAAMVVASFYFWMRSEALQVSRWSWWLGVVLGLGMLVKYTLCWFVVGPIVWVLATRRHAARDLGLLGAAVGVLLSYTAVVRQLLPFDMGGLLLAPQAMPWSVGWMALCASWAWWYRGRSESVVNNLGRCLAAAGLTGGTWYLVNQKMLLWRWSPAAAALSQVVGECGRSFIYYLLAIPLPILLGFVLAVATSRQRPWISFTVAAVTSLCLTCWCLPPSARYGAPVLVMVSLIVAMRASTFIWTQRLALGFAIAAFLVNCCGFLWTDTPASGMVSKVWALTWSEGVGTPAGPYQPGDTGAQDVLRVLRSAASDSPCYSVALLRGLGLGEDPSLFALELESLWHDPRFMCFVVFLTPSYRVVYPDAYTHLRHAWIVGQPQRANPPRAGWRPDFVVLSTSERDVAPAGLHQASTAFASKLVYVGSVRTVADSLLEIYALKPISR